MKLIVLALIFQFVISCWPKTKMLSRLKLMFILGLFFVCLQLQEQIRDQEREMEILKEANEKLVNR